MIRKPLQIRKLSPEGRANDADAQVIHEIATSKAVPRATQLITK